MVLWIATSISVMGVNKVSSFVEFLVLITFIGMFGLAVIYVIEMVFGNSDLASNIRWNIGSSPYTLLLVTACIAFFLILWLAVTPLKSASLRSDVVPESLAEYDRVEESKEKKVTPAAQSFDFLKEIVESDKRVHLTTIEENSSKTVHSLPPEETPITVSAGEDLKNEVPESIEKTLRIDGNSQVVKEKDSKIDGWKLEELVKAVPEINQLVRPDGPPSFKSLKHDGVGSGTGSWSKLAGLGRVARRQLAAVPDEFWGQLFDFHGEPTQEAKARKLDKLLGIDSKVNMNPKPKALKVDNRSSFDSSWPQSVQAHSPSSLLSTQMQLLDAYAQQSNLDLMDADDKRYHILRLQSSSGGSRIPQASSGYDHQPATIHGYQIKSYMNQIEPLAPKSPSLGSANYNGPVAVTPQVTG